MERSQEALLAQLVLRFPEGQARHWQARWTQACASTVWIEGDVVYHEVVAVLGPDRSIRVWDSTEGCWLDRVTALSAGAIEAIRVVSSPTGGRVTTGAGLTWDGAAVEVDEWTWL